MRYNVEVREIVITNVMVEADSKEEAVDKARGAVEDGWCSYKPTEREEINFKVKEIGD